VNAPSAVFNVHEKTSAAMPAGPAKPQRSSRFSTPERSGISALMSAV
jgi:hypothetical protein